MMPSEYYSNFTACINSSDLIAIEKAVVDLLEREGGKQLDIVPSADKIDKNSHWIVGIFPGKEGWTIAKTWIPGLLCAPTVDKTRPRLSALATQLQCDTFDFSVFNGIAGILLEADSEGNVAVSGYYYENDVNTYYDLPINNRDSIKDFSLLKVSDSLKSAIEIDRHPMIIDPECDRPSWLDEPPLGYDDPSDKGYTHKIDEALRFVLDISGIWAYPDLLYAINQDSAILSAAKGHLLYFQPPENYQHPYAYKLTPQI